MYLEIYTREEKMCPQGAVFLQYSLESVVSSERLLEKRSFFDSLKEPVVRQVLSVCQKSIILIFTLRAAARIK